ncbi:MAG TPA: DUF1016 N-terminal domain-containing protein [bacterium]|nr:DUF1016 N-terminal domain-containing protein [bacterium]
MQTIALVKSSAVETYVGLRRRVKGTLILGQRRIKQEKVRTYWQTGKLIHEHVLSHKERADYGKEVVRRLSHDLGLGERLLYRCIQFAEQEPNLSAWTKSGTDARLTWSHYRALMAIPDEKKRRGLAENFMRNKLRRI